MSVENEIMTAEQLQGALGTLTISTKTIANSLGVLQSAVSEHSMKLMQHDEEIASFRQDFEAEKARNRDRERIEADEVNHVTEAIKSRVKDLLDDTGRFDLFGKFCAKCRCDCKRHSYYRGINAVDTKQMYYRELLEYIGNWTPEGFGGVSGYINHLDKKARDR